VSSKAHAKILNVDPSEALSMPGVTTYVGHEDVRGRNIWGPVIQDEELFASSMVGVHFLYAGIF